ncbi:hypothetical protein [Clavibacter michiganensis]|uniref:Uncharacterized protein n=1 Tax=Clavibacter michiganensis TaxID=28447 RepID=A0A251YS25_9MICO|nr:hypothetical protein [Clavibacter michiganensis]OUE27005.1 hypothetical protein BFL37_02705 [Clavibacter michiganensis]
MPVTLAPTTAPTPPATHAATAPRPGDPACVDFAGTADGLRHAGTRSLEVDLGPMLAAARAQAPSGVGPAAPLAA